MKLQGKNVILTGASRGFGKYLSRRLWDEGASLFLLSRTPPNAIDIINPIRYPYGPNRFVEYHCCDLGGRIDLDEALDKIYRKWGAIDGVVNNAAIQGPVGKAWEFVVSEDWDNTFKINLHAPIRLCQWVVPAMLKQGHGKIVNLSGGGAANPRPNYSAYATAKAGLVRFSECLAEELRGTGIDVNCVSPGKMPTGMLPPGETAMEQTMSDAADLVIWLLSEESNGVTGKLISAVWDDWRRLPSLKDDLTASELYTLRRVTELKVKA